MIPLATIAALEGVIAAVQPAEIWCLGDSFHDSAGCDRLPQAAMQSLRRMTGALRWIWITGNHDADLVDRCGGAVMGEALVDGLVLRHEAEPSETRPELSGHFHPKLRVSLRGRQVARRCFVATETKLILPAFGVAHGRAGCQPPGNRPRGRRRGAGAHPGG